MLRCCPDVHFQTTLLDTLRSDGIKVADNEEGAITQTITAFSVSMDGDSESSASSGGTSLPIAPAPNSVTFIDTPGHGAFKLMREKVGAIVDAAVLVVSAREGFGDQVRSTHPDGMVICV